MPLDTHHAYDAAFLRNPEAQSFSREVILLQSAELFLDRALDVGLEFSAQGRRRELPHEFAKEGNHGALVRGAVAPDSHMDCLCCLIEARFITQGSAERHQTWALGGSEARWRTVPMRRLKTWGSLSADA